MRTPARFFCAVPRFQLVTGLAAFAGAGCAGQHGTADAPRHATTQTTEQWSELGVSLKADVTRMDGLTRVEFSWSGLKEPGVLVVNFDTADPLKYDRGGAALYGVTLIRRVPRNGNASLVFHHQRLAEGIQDLAMVNVFLTNSVRIHVSHDSGVKGSPVVRTDELAADACPNDFNLIASSRDKITQTAFITPHVEKLKIEMPPRGGVLADVRDLNNVRAQVQVPVDLRLPLRPAPDLLLYGGCP